MQKTNFFYLLVALLFLLLSVPITDDLRGISAPVAKAVVFSVMLLIGIWSLRGSGRFFSIGLAFVVAGFVLNIVAINSHITFFEYTAILAVMGFLLVTITFTLRQVVVGTEINANRLVGAICVYLMLGVIWALAYSLVELATPGSFGGVAAGQDAGWDSEWLYFSFVTLTTLGYGDILPLSELARALAYMEAVTGQFYVAILVAGLVSAYISDRQSA
jgi:hypothetical protein